MGKKKKKGPARFRLETIEDGSWVERRDEFDERQRLGAVRGRRIAAKNTAFKRWNTDYWDARLDCK